MKKQLKYAVLTAMTVSTCVLSAQTSNPFRGATSATGDIAAIAAAVGAILGGLFALIGGARVGYKMSQGEEFTKDLMFAIGAFVIGIVCVVAM